MTPLLAAVAAGALGAVLRHVATVLLPRPWGVLAVNAVACLIAGVGLGLALDPATRLVLVSGLCGGLSTFSTFAVETVDDVAAGRTRRAVVSVAANLAVGLVATVAGAVLGSLA